MAFTHEEKRDIYYDNADRLQWIIDDLKKLGGHEDDVEVLNDIRERFEEAGMIYTDELWRRDEADDEAIMRDYYKELI